MSTAGVNGSEYYQKRVWTPDMQSRGQNPNMSNHKTLPPSPIARLCPIEIKCEYVSTMKHLSPAFKASHLHVNVLVYVSRQGKRNVRSDPPQRRKYVLMWFPNINFIRLLLLLVHILQQYFQLFATLFLLIRFLYHL